MKIAMVGPISMDLLKPVIDSGTCVPPSHSFGMSADLVNGLLSKGHSVDVFTLAPGAKKTFHVEFEELRIWAIPTRGRLSALRFYSSEVFGLSKFLLASGPHAVTHTHWLYEYSLAALSVESNSLVTVHDWPGLVLRNDPSFTRFIKWMFSKFVIPKVKFASAPSQYMVDVASDILRLKGVVLIPNALPSSLVLENPSSDSHGPNEVLVAINNGFSPRKNISTLLQAMRRVRRSVPNARLRLVGSGYGAGEDAHRYALRMGLTDGVDFLGRLGREQVLGELTRATAFVHPSKEESFGLVLAEAMARQTPVIAGRNSGAVPWILEDGKSGALCDVESEEDLANTIIGLITSPERQAQYIENGLQRVKSSFMMDQMITRFEALYQRIASAKH